MESKMQIFDSAQFGRIRTFDVKGNPWFVGRDVAVALGYGAHCKRFKRDGRKGSRDKLSSLSPLTAIGSIAV